MNAANYQSRIEPYNYKDDVFRVLLDRLVTCDSTDALGFVIAINELYAPSEYEQTFERDDNVAEDPDKRHWTKV